MVLAHPEIVKPHLVREAGTLQEVLQVLLRRHPGAAHGIAVNVPKREYSQFHVDYRANLNVTSWNGRRAKLTLPCSAGVTPGASTGRSRRSVACT